MKEITSIALNTMALVQDGKFEPQAEVALTLSEIGYCMNTAGTIGKERTAETFRFGASPENLRKLAKQLNEFADVVEKDVIEALASHGKAKP